MPARIKIEPIKSLDEFKEFIEKHGLEFTAMAVSGYAKNKNRWVFCYSDKPITEIMVKSFDSIDYDYIIYSGEYNEKFYVAVEIKL